MVHKNRSISDICILDALDIHCVHLMKGKMCIIWTKKCLTEHLSWSLHWWEKKKNIKHDVPKEDLTSANLKMNNLKGAQTVAKTTSLISKHRHSTPKWPKRSKMRNKYGKRKSHIGRRFSQQTVMLVIIHLEVSKEQLPDSSYLSLDSTLLLADILSHLANSS